MKGCGKFIAPAEQGTDGDRWGQTERFLMEFARVLILAGLSVRRTSYTNSKWQQTVAVPGAEASRMNNHADRWDRPMGQTGRFHRSTLTVRCDLFQFA